MRLSPEYVITLVHGTWGSGGSWTQPDSRLCRLLTAQLGRSIIESYEWSGHNSVAARRTAGEGLEKHLLRLVDSHPTAKHFVIAHSHGGMVALCAIADTRLQKAIHGVVCLSTPFIHARARNLGGFGPAGLALMVPFTFLVPAFFLLLTYSTSEPFGWGALGRFWASWLLFGALAGGLLVLFARCFGLWQKVSERVLDMYHLPDILDTQLLIVRVAGDEASGVLTTSQFVLWLTHNVWGRIRWVADTVTGFAFRVAKAICFWRNGIPMALSFVLGVVGCFMLAWIVIYNSANPVLGAGAFLVLPFGLLVAPMFYLALIAAVVRGLAGILLIGILVCSGVIPTCSPKTAPQGE